MKFIKINVQMEQFLIYQVRINLIQQNIVNLKKNDTDTFYSVANDIAVLFGEVMKLNDSFLMQEYIPQIHGLCKYLDTKKPTNEQTQEFDEIIKT